MSGEAAFRRWLCALLLTTAAVGVSIGFVDRPLAQFLEEQVRHTQFWVWLAVALRPIALVAVAALFFVLGCGLVRISGRRLRSWTELPLLLSWATIFAVATEIIVKRIFGRSGPDPTFVRDHLYGFHFLHGQTYWDAFPSGTALVSMALVSVLWMAQPRWRLPSLLIALLLLIAVIIGNFHWLSDVVAGAFLGVTVGWSTVRLWRPSECTDGVTGRD